MLEPRCFDFQLMDPSFFLLERIHSNNNNNNRRLVTLAEHTSDHGRQTNSFIVTKSKSCVDPLELLSALFIYCKYSWNYLELTTQLSLLPVPSCASCASVQRATSSAPHNILGPTSAMFFSANFAHHTSICQRKQRREAAILALGRMSSSR